MTVDLHLSLRQLAPDRHRYPAVQCCPRSVVMCIGRSLTCLRPAALAEACIEGAGTIGRSAPGALPTARGRLLLNTLSP
jgi:hypothetical protein